ncbi:hypothetical protein AB0947_40605, partial [Streptomyces sp. NPDC047841]
SHLPSGATPKPVWLWWSGTDATAADADRLWQAYLRRFDIEHTFRLFKQTLGWTSSRVRRDFRHIRPQTACPAGAPKPTRPGPGRPAGRKNTRPAPRHDVHTPKKTQPVERQKRATSRWCDHCPAGPEERGEDCQDEYDDQQHP